MKRNATTRLKAREVMRRTNDRTTAASPRLGRRFTGLYGIKDRVSTHRITAKPAGDVDTARIYEMQLWQPDARGQLRNMSAATRKGVSRQMASMTSRRCRAATRAALTASERHRALSIPLSGCIPVPSVFEPGSR